MFSFRINYNFFEELPLLEQEWMGKMLEDEDFRELLAVPVNAGCVEVG